MLIYLLVLIVFIFILCRCYVSRNTKEPFIIRTKGFKKKLKKKIKKKLEKEFGNRNYKKIVELINKFKENETILNIIHQHYSNVDKDFKKELRDHVVSQANLLKPGDNLECKLFKKCDQTGTTGVCGTLLSSITKSMKKTETCAHYKSVLDEIKQLITEE